MFVERFGDVVLDATGFARRNARGRAGSGQVLPEALRIEAPVSNDPAASKGRNQHGDGTKIMSVSGDDIQSNGTSKTVNNGRQFGVRPTLGFYDHLRSRSTHGIGGLLVNFDVAAIDTAQLTDRIRYQQFVHL